MTRKGVPLILSLVRPSAGLAPVISYGKIAEEVVSLVFVLIVYIKLTVSSPDSESTSATSISIDPSEYSVARLSCGADVPRSPPLNLYLRSLLISICGFPFPDPIADSGICGICRSFPNIAYIISLIIPGSASIESPTLVNPISLSVLSPTYK